MRFKALPVLLLVASSVIALACGSGGDPKPASGQDAATASGPVTLRLGYFPNVTHAQPIVGLARGTFAEALGPQVTLETKTFNAGGDEITALFSGNLDIGYIGPSPAVNGYVKSKGQDVRIIAGATSGGASLIVRNGAGIQQASDFANKKVATPQLGNTQDVALRAWLRDRGLAAKEQGGNVTVIPTENATTLALFQKGELDAAWVPEPWATRLVQEAGGQEFLDEKALWPDGKFPTTTVIVRTAFLKKYPDVVRAFLRAHVQTTAWINANPAEAMQLVNAGIEQITGKALKPALIAAAWPRIVASDDPLASAVQTGAQRAIGLGFLASKPALSDLFSLDLLNEVLRAEGQPEVKE